MNNVSILVLTLNEELNLPGCLKSVAWSDDIVVLDSYSSDRTLEIAAEFGARVFQRTFDDCSSHQNWAVENIPFRNEWVYYTDADERVTEDLKQELLAIANDPSCQYVAYRVRFKNFFMGRWNKRTSLYPTWVLRFFKPGSVRWERLTNPVAIVDGDVGCLSAHFEHYSFNKGMADWFRKHNAYSSDEAQELLKSRIRGVDWPSLWSGNAAVRRKALKELAFHLPFRPLLVFTYLYFFRMGFLEGIPGLHYCCLRSIYEYMIDIKVAELKSGHKWQRI
jgi:glycosyltransferase involved in cell wall biosynthesis